MTRFAIALTLLAACATDTSTLPVGGGSPTQGKPESNPAPTPPISSNGTWSETQPELPGLTLLHDGARVAVLAEDGTELCTLDDTGARVDVAELSYACGELSR